MRHAPILWSLLAVLATDASAGPAPVRAPRDTTQACGTRSGLALVYVPGGRLATGEAAGEPHVAELADFLIGKYEVTQADWAEVLGQRPSRFGACAECPVEQVSWHDVQRFLRVLNQRTGRAYRLPTEDEWEFAARGGARAGPAATAACAWHAGNAEGRTHRVGSLAANALGLFDTGGNVDEWCTPCAETAPGTGVLRGGAWLDPADAAGPRGRTVCATDRRLQTVGFRLAQSVERPARAERVRIQVLTPEVPGGVTTRVIEPAASGDR